MPRTKKTQVASPSEPKGGLFAKLKKWFIYVSCVWTVISAIGGVFVAVVMQGEEFLTKLEKLPAAIVKSVGKYSSWRADDEGWNGIWSHQAEGYTNVGDMNLNDVEIRLEIVAERGHIGGSVATRKLCAALPMFDYVLIVGTADSNFARVKVFDFIGGKRREFGEVELRRDGVVMTVIPVGDMKELFPPESRIALHPNSTAFGNDDGKREAFCKAEREAFHARLQRQKGRK